MAQYLAMLLAQGGKCAICGEMPKRALAVDHCHATKATRGLLCVPCNLVLGIFKDDVARLENAARYLRQQFKYTEEVPMVRTTASKTVR